MEPRNVIVLTPPGAPDPALAIAASRAGANGVLDLEYANDWHEVSSAIERLTKCRDPLRSPDNQRIYRRHHAGFKTRPD